MYSAEQLGSLVESVYDASIDGLRWPNFLAQSAQQLGGILPTLFMHDTRAHSGALAINVGYEAGTVRSYKEHFAERNLWLRSGAHLLTPGSVRTSHIMCSRQAFLASEWYADYCCPLNISQGIGATIHKDSMVTSNVAIFAGDDRADFGGEDIALLKKPVFLSMSGAPEVSFTALGRAADATNEASKKLARYRAEWREDLDIARTRDS